MMVVMMMMISPYTEKYLKVHIDEADEGKNSSSQSRMPYKGECVPLNSLDFRTNNNKKNNNKKMSR